MGRKSNLTEAEFLEEKKEEQQNVEEPKKFQNESKSLFSSSKEGGTRLS